MKRVFTATVFIFVACSINVPAQSESREDLLKQIEAKRADLAVLENKILSPSAEDKAAFAEFLKQEDTGLIRLLPREEYDETPNKTGTLTVSGGGAYYSFDRLTHAYGYGSDIELSQGYLSVGFAGCDYGVILRAGAVSLDEISLEHPRASFLTAYKAAASEPEARVEQRRFGNGDTIEGIKYVRRVKAEIGTAYVLRSISYNRSDLLVALKVVRQDTDGSLIIAWKLLKKFPKPELARDTAAQ
jgi:hypothetical protein